MDFVASNRFFLENNKGTLGLFALPADRTSKLNKKTIPLFHLEAQLREMERRNSNQERQKKNRFGFKPSPHNMTLPFNSCISMRRHDEKRHEEKAFSHAGKYPSRSPLSSRKGSQSSFVFLLCEASCGISHDVEPLKNKNSHSPSRIENPTSASDPPSAIRNPHSHPVDGFPDGQEVFSQGIHLEQFL